MGSRNFRRECIVSSRDNKRQWALRPYCIYGKVTKWPLGHCVSRDAWHTVVSDTEPSFLVVSAMTLPTGSFLNNNKTELL